jgi:hypothetical protein
MGCAAITAWLPYVLVCICTVQSWQLPTNQRAGNVELCLPGAVSPNRHSSIIRFLPSHVRYKHTAFCTMGSSFSDLLSIAIARTSNFINSTNSWFLTSHVNLNFQYHKGINANIFKSCACPDLSTVILPHALLNRIAHYVRTRRGGSS